MHKFFTKSILSICCMSFVILQAQTVLTNKIQPSVGDSLYFALDSTTVGISYGTPGPNQEWDFRNLKITASRSEVYRPASAGNQAARFPSADAVLIQGINEQYFKFYADRIELLGTATLGGGPLPGVGGANVFPKPVVIQKFPEAYLDELMYVTSNTVTLPSSILPDSLLNSLPLRPDSFRIIFSQRFQKIADAWGELKLPAKNWNVLREKRTTTGSTKIEAKVAILGWVDVTALASGIFGGLFGNINNTSYAFVSNETKGVVAQVNVDTLGNILTISYKPDDKTYTDVSNLKIKGALKVYPNPTSDYLTIEMPNKHYQYSHYEIVDLKGKMVKRILATTDFINLTDIESGIYFLRVYQKKTSNPIYEQSFVKK
ncbi:MAG: T9SS type A sorting domain-containing protein [Saprospiraceae bacterium]|nr:T9SS type A sorting domain-containing protein [Saprospiraceae bacterium]